MSRCIFLALSLLLTACPMHSGADAGFDAGESADAGAAYEVLDGGLYKFTNENPRTCDAACGELGLDCRGAWFNNRRVAAIYDFGECARSTHCGEDLSEIGLCYSDRPPYALQWFACGCVPYADAGP